MELCLARRCEPGRGRDPRGARSAADEGEEGVTHDAEGPRLVLPVGPRDHGEGPTNAPVTLVEYGDYECPHCARAYPIVKAVQKRLGRRLRFVFRNFPLKEMHPHAEHAAEVA